jgi:non-heme chloroperoxidase
MHSPAVVSSIALPHGITLSYAEQGDAGGPVVVFLPGPTDSWRSYGEVLAALPPSVRAVAVSLRGHGDSDKPAAGHRIEDLASDVVPLLDELGVGRAVLAGHSGSCLVARRIALDHPGRVAGLVLEASPSTLRGHRGLTTFVDSVVSGITDPIGAAFARSLVADTSSTSLASSWVDELVGEIVKVPARVWRELFADLLEYDDLDELDRIAVPALLVWGDADELVDRDMQSALLSRLRHGRLLVAPGAGHTPRWELPERFAADVAAFVEATW